MTEEAMNVGIAIGGPLDGQQLSAGIKAKTLNIPVQTGPDRGEGDRGFGAHVYRWDEATGRWMY